MGQYEAKNVEIPFDDVPMDNEERELMAYTSSPEFLEQIKKSVTLRLSNGVLEGVKAKAEEAGLPYQTLINSILHRYITGDIVVKTSV